MYNYFLHNKQALCSCLITLQTSVIANFNVLCMNPSQVTGGSGRLYTCFVSCHYCPCPAFSYTVLRRNDGLLVSFMNRAIKNVSKHQFVPCWHIQARRRALSDQTRDKSNAEMCAADVLPSGGKFIWPLRGIFRCDRPFFALNISERASLVLILV